MGLALAGEQLTERPGGSKAREVGGAQVLERGVEISQVQDMTAPGKPTVSYAYFNDPDGNGWALQKLPYGPPSASYTIFSVRPTWFHYRKVRPLPRRGGGDGAPRTASPGADQRRGHRGGC